MPHVPHRQLEGGVEEDLGVIWREREPVHADGDVRHARHPCRPGAGDPVLPAPRSIGCIEGARHGRLCRTSARLTRICTWIRIACAGYCRAALLCTVLHACACVSAGARAAPPAVRGCPGATCHGPCGRRLVHIRYHGRYVFCIRLVRDCTARVPAWIAVGRSPQHTGRDKRYIVTAPPPTHTRPRPTVRAPQRDNFRDKTVINVINFVIIRDAIRERI